MILKDISKRLLVMGVFAALSFVADAQIMTSGKIVFERKTNLKKRYKNNPQLKRFLPEDMTWKIEEFELYFNDSSSAFLPVESGESASGFMKYLTTQNTIYTDLNNNEKLAVLDMWGTKTYVKDSITQRQWKVTESKRKIGGYLCRKAMWEMNDSTRIYAWFSTDLVPSVGPEGFAGLPGTILGLATEDGGIIYFAKEITAMTPPEDKITPSVKGKDVFTKEELKTRLIEKAGKWVKPEDIDIMFLWL